MLIVVTDTGPLWSFAVVGRLDLLGLRWRGRVAWTGAVAEEIRRNAVREPRLADVAKQDWLPEPIDLAAAGLSEQAFRIRYALATPGDHPLQHLGEAECIAYARHHGNAAVATEDRSAAARAEFHRLPVFRTTDVLSEMAAMGDADRPTIWNIYLQLAQVGRLPLGLRTTDLFE